MLCPRLSPLWWAGKGCVNESCLRRAQGCGGSQTGGSEILVTSMLGVFHVSYDSTHLHTPPNLSLIHI